MLNEDLKKYCPTDTPITIPYMEVYRTDELYYKDYVSPLNNSDASTAESGNTNNVTDASEVTSGSSSNNSSSSSSSSSSSNNEKTRQLYTKLSTAVQRYFKSGVNVNTLVNRYRNCAGNKQCIINVTTKSKVWLKSGMSINIVSEAIYQIIKNHNK